MCDGIMFVKADATLEMEQRDFARAALEYVCLIQEVRWYYLSGYRQVYFK